MSIAKPKAGNENTFAMILLSANSCPFVTEEYFAVRSRDSDFLEDVLYVVSA